MPSLLDKMRKAHTKSFITAYYIHPDILGLEKINNVIELMKDPEYGDLGPHTNKNSACLNPNILYMVPLRVIQSWNSGGTVTLVCTYSTFVGCSVIARSKRVGKEDGRYENAVEGGISWLSGRIKDAFGEPVEELVEQDGEKLFLREDAPETKPLPICSSKIMGSVCAPKHCKASPEAVFFYFVQLALGVYNVLNDYCTEIPLSLYHDDKPSTTLHRLHLKKKQKENERREVRDVLEICGVCSTDRKRFKAFFVGPPLNENIVYKKISELKSPADEALARTIIRMVNGDSDPASVKLIKSLNNRRPMAPSSKHWHEVLKWIIAGNAVTLVDPPEKLKKRLQKTDTASRGGPSQTKRSRTAERDSSSSSSSSSVSPVRGFRKPTDIVSPDDVILSVAEDACKSSNPGTLLFTHCVRTKQTHFYGPLLNLMYIHSRFPGDSRMTEDKENEMTLTFHTLLAVFLAEKLDSITGSQYCFYYPTKPELGVLFSVYNDNQMCHRVVMNQ